MRCREQHREWAALRLAHDGGSVASDRIHDRPNVVHSLLEGGRTRHAVRHAHSALVEEDQACELTQPLAVAPELRKLPVHLEVRHGALDVDEVDGSVADDAVRDVDVAAAREPDLGHTREAARLPE